MLILADAATATPDGKLFIHGGGITRITAATLPWVQPQIALVARFLMEDADFEQSHELQLSIADPSGALLVPPVPIEFPQPTVPDVQEGEERFMQIALGLASLTFTTEGLYEVELRMDGEVVRSLPLAVVAARLDESGGLVTGRQAPG